MKISKEKKRTIISLTPREVEELEFMIGYADEYWRGYPTEIDDAAEVKKNKECIAVLRKWCKAFGLQSRANLYYTRYSSSDC